MSDQVKTEWLIQACEPQVYKIVVNAVKESQGDLEESLTKLGEIFPTLENDLKLRKKIEALPPSAVRTRTPTSRVFSSPIRKSGTQVDCKCQDRPRQIACIDLENSSKNFPRNSCKSNFEAQNRHLRRHEAHIAREGQGRLG